jgi:hypothetical protein
MKSRLFLIAILLLVLAGIGIVVWNRASSKANPTATSQSNNNANSAPFAWMENQKPSVNTESALVETRIAYLPNHDPKRVKKITDDIHTAIASGDMGAVSRAFNMAAYSRGFKNSELQEAFKVFLNNANTQVRLLASKYLYLTGDNTGKNTLIGIMQSPKPSLVDGVDQRLLAAQLLTQYREDSVLSALVEFYEKCKTPGLLHDILMMSQGQVPASIYNEQSRSSDPYGLFALSLSNPQLATEKAKTAFNSPKVSGIYKASIINTAAWVMAANGTMDPYLAHLIAQSEKAIRQEIPSGYDTNVYREALKYLGSVDSPQVREVLQAGLQSESAEVVQYSAINLLFNQSGGYESVKQRLLHELNPSNVKDFKLGEELKWHLVTVLSNDLDVSRAAQAYSKQTQLFDWEYNVVERKSWPIYNWVDNYVVKLNRTTPQK